MRLTEKHFTGKGYYMRCSENCRRTNCIDCEELEKLVDRLGELEDKEERGGDAVPVERCKHCNHWQRNCGVTDSPNGHCFLHDIDLNGNDFCSYGERRNDEET